jgi:PAS domain S-box-containing protein
MKKDKRFIESFRLLRKKAITILEKNPPSSELPLSENEVLKLLQELEVRQIELELQNDELKRSKAREAELATEKYVALYDFAPLGYFTITREGEIVELNLSAAQMLGKERSRLKNKRFALYISPESKSIFSLFLENVLSSTTKKNCKITLVNADKIEVFVHITGIVSENPNQCFISVVDISDRKRSEAIFRDVVQKNPMSIQFLDMEGYTVGTNLAHTKLFGVTPPADYSIFKDTQLEQQGLEKLFEQIKKGDVVYFPDSYFNVHDVDPSFPDSPVWVKAVGFTLNDNNGTPERIVLMHENITERKHAEALLTDIIEMNPMSIQIVDKEGYTLHGNPAYNKLFGAIPPPDFSIFDDLQNKSKELKQLIKLAKGGEVVYLPEIYFNPHDEVSEAPDVPLWIRALIFPLNDNCGKPERFVFMHENITERKKAEQELITAKQRAEESEVKYRQIFDNTFDIMAIYEVTEDRRYKVITFNTAEAKLIGPVENYQNRYIDECIPPELYSQFKRNYERCLAAEKLIVYEEDISFRDIHKTFNTQLIPLKNSTGRIHRIIVISRDITENKLLQTQLIDQNEKLKLLNIDLIESKEKAEESDRLKSAFLANMSHEIRTPMNGILGFSELLKEADLTNEQQLYYINIIEKSGARMLNIINDIVDISKIESGQMNVSVSEISVNELIENIYLFFKSESEGKGLKISFQNALPVMESIICSDSEKIYAILTNLVKNAIKFTKTGGIELGYEKMDGYLLFFVKDTGIGIRPDQLEMVFERFRQGNDLLSRDYEGSGLGLSISKAYVEMLGGKIWVESKVRVSSEINDGGSTFYFTHPYATPTVSNNLNPNPDSKEIKPAKMRKLKVLIAEDDEGSEMFLSAVLKKFCSEILVTKTGTNAVEICRNNPDLDLILMDIKMLEMDGYQATSLIRQFNKDVIIIAQTAFAQNGVRELAIEAGCTDYLSKPIQRSKLMEVLHRYFEK